MTGKVNAFPPHLRGLWRVKASPYPYKDRWPEADFGRRWQTIKAKLRIPAVSSTIGSDDR